MIENTERRSSPDRRLGGFFPEKFTSVEVESGEFPNSLFKDIWTESMAEDCHSHPLWQDPFMRTLESENSTPAERFALASVWSGNMVEGSYCFPRYVATLAARAPLDEVRHGLLENAYDESGGKGHTKRSHFWLAVRLSNLLGLSDEDIKNIQPLPEARTYTDEHYRQCATGNFGFALGKISLIEEFTTPEFTHINNAFLSSCKTGMGVTPEEFKLRGGEEYFTANIEDDERHRLEMPRLVASWLHGNGVNLNNPAAIKKGLEPVREGARRSADLRQNFFKGIYRYVEAEGTLKSLVRK